MASCCDVVGTDQTNWHRHKGVVSCTLRTILAAPHCFLNSTHLRQEERHQQPQAPNFSSSFELQLARTENLFLEHNKDTENPLQELNKDMADHKAETEKRLLDLNSLIIRSSSPRRSDKPPSPSQTPQQDATEDIYGNRSSLGATYSKDQGHSLCKTRVSTPTGFIRIILRYNSHPRSIRAASDRYNLPFGHINKSSSY